MGGTSAEREVSLRSGKAIYDALKGSGYNAVSIDVGPDFCNVVNKEKMEIAFIALHGGYGEDGSIQGMLEVLGIPYTGSTVLASALAMDKEASKKIFLYHGIPVPPFIVLDMDSSVTTPPFDLPWVIKPATEGRRVGVSIEGQKGFEKSLEQAYSYGSRALVEQYIAGKEAQIGILNGKVSELRSDRL
jgi:D-alanine-D-alanine ligase